MHPSNLSLLSVCVCVCVFFCFLIKFCFLLTKAEFLIRIGFRSMFCGFIVASLELYKMFNVKLTICPCTSKVTTVNRLIGSAMQAHSDFKFS